MSINYSFKKLGCERQGNSQMKTEVEQREKGVNIREKLRVEERG